MDVQESISGLNEYPRPFIKAGKWEPLADAISAMSHYLNCDAAMDPEHWERRNDLFKRTKGVEVVIRKKNEILLDLDDLESMDRAHHMLGILGETDFIKSVDSWPSKSAKPGPHITPQGFEVDWDREHWRITTNISLTPDEAAFFQSIMGSDPQRELLNFLGHKAGIKEPSKLYKYPEKKEGRCDGATA